MEDKGREAFPEHSAVSTVNDAPPPYSEQYPAAGYPGAAPGYGYDQQVPPQGGGYPSRPYPTQQYLPAQQQYGYPQTAQPPQGYGAPVAMQPMPAPVQPVRVNRQY